MIADAVGRRAVATRLAGNAPAFRKRLERMGPTFVKIGQFLALRPDLVPHDYSRELMSLLDRVPPLSWDVARSVIEAELGGPIADTFERIDTRAYAAGSLAQMHVARLRDGRSVAVKVQRPGIEKQIERDLRRAAMIARLLERSGLSLVISPEELVEEVGFWLEQELDMRNELRNMRRLHKLAADSPYECIPEPVPELSTGRVLTSTFVRGIPLSDLLASLQSGDPTELERVRRLGIDRETLSSTVIAAVLRQIFVYRFFHADVHPGNLLALPDGRIGFVDFGLCDTLDDSVRRGQLEGLTAAYNGDVDQMFEALVKILEPSPETDLAAFRRDFTASTKGWLARIQTEVVMDEDEDEPYGARLLGADPPSRPDSAQALGSAVGSPVGQWMKRTVEAAREHDLTLPPRVLSMYRTLLTAEAVAQHLGADVDLRAVGRNFFARMQIQEQLRSIGPDGWQRMFSDTLTLYRDGPHQLSRVLEDLSEGRLNLNVTVSESAAAAGGRARRVRLVAAAVVAVSLALLLVAPANSDPALRAALWAALGVTYGLVAVLYRRAR